MKEMCNPCASVNIMHIYKNKSGNISNNAKLSTNISCFFTKCQAAGHRITK